MVAMILLWAAYKTLSEHSSGSETSDMWAIAACLYELYTGKYLFPGKDNSHMLKLIQEYFGKFPKKVLNRSIFRELYYTEDLRFIDKREDKVTKRVLLVYHDILLSSR